MECHIICLNCNAQIHDTSELNALQAWNALPRPNKRPAKVTITLDLPDLDVAIAATSLLLDLAEFPYDESEFANEDKSWQREYLSQFNTAHEIGRTVHIALCDAHRTLLGENDAKD
jgi:hypothetical protein